MDRAFTHVESIGAVIVKPPTRADWGGYTGYSPTRTGTCGRIAFAPGFPVDESGRIDIT